MTQVHPLLAAAAAFPVWCLPVAAQEAEPVAPEADDASATLELTLEAPELLANSPEVDALLAKMRAAHKGLLRYDYQASVGVQVMMGGPGGADDAMEAQFLRKGSVVQGGPLGTLVQIKKSLELPGMEGMAGAMNEEMRVLVRKKDLLFDIKPSEMAAMTGGPQGLARITHADLTEIHETMPMPAAMNFVMMQTPRYVDPLEMVDELASQVGLNKVARTGDGKVILSGPAPASLVPSMGPREEDANPELRLTLDAGSLRLQQVQIGNVKKPIMQLTLSAYSVPEELQPSDFDLNPDGKEVGDYASMLRKQMEAMMQMGAHGGDAFDDEDEF